MKVFNVLDYLFVKIVDGSIHIIFKQRRRNKHIARGDARGQFLPTE